MSLEELRCALASAIVKGDLPTVRQLLNDHPNINVNDFSVDFCAKGPRDRFQRARSERYHPRKLLHLAAYAQQVDIVSFLLKEKRASVTLRNDQGETAIHSALYYPLAPRRASRATIRAVTAPFPSSSKLQVIKLLLKYGADIRATDKAGQTALHMALFDWIDEREDIVLYLINQGCPLDAHDKDGYTPFHFACGQASTPIVRRMMELGASPTAPDADGWSPLHAASACNPHVQVLELLIDAGADSNLRTVDYANTPIHLSWTVRNARVLFEKGGADLTLLNSFGETPAQIAIARERFVIARYLQLAQDFDGRRKECMKLIFNLSDSASSETNKAKQNAVGVTSPVNEDDADIASNHTSTSSEQPSKGTNLGLLSKTISALIKDKVPNQADLVTAYACLRKAITQ